MKKFLILSLVSLFSVTAFATESVQSPKSTFEYKNTINPQMDYFFTADVVNDVSLLVVNEVPTISVNESFTTVVPDLLKFGLTFKIIEYEFYCRTISNYKITYKENSKYRNPDLPDIVNQDRQN